MTFRSSYGITLDKIAMIPLVFYLTQLLIDLAATKFADKIGYRTCVVASQILSAVLFAASPSALCGPALSAYPPGAVQRAGPQCLHFLHWPEI